MRIKSTDSSSVSAISCFRRLPSASVSFRYLPSASISGRIWAVRSMETFLGDRMMMSGIISGNPTVHGANLRIKSPDSRDACVIFCFRQLPSSSVFFRHLPSASIPGRIWSVRLMDTRTVPGRRCRGIIYGNPTFHGSNFRGHRPILMLLRPCPCYRRCVLEYRIRVSSVPARRFKTIRCSIDIRAVIFPDRYAVIGESANL